MKGVSSNSRASLQNSQEQLSHDKRQQQSSYEQECFMRMVQIMESKSVISRKVPMGAAPLLDERTKFDSRIFDCAFQQNKMLR